MADLHPCKPVIAGGAGAVATFTAFDFFPVGSNAGAVDETVAAATFAAPAAPAAVAVVAVVAATLAVAASIGTSTATGTGGCA
jgi:hypothetical protein